MKKLLPALLLVLSMISYIDYARAQKEDVPSVFKSILSNTEFQVDPNMVYNSAPLNQYRQSIAFNGEVYLVVWEDNRTNFDYKIYGARLDSQGNLLDPAGFVICNARGDQEFPSVASNGDIFLVSWQDYIVYSPTGTDIHGARVKADGTVLDPEGLVICNAVESQRYPKIAASESQFCIVWEDERNGLGYPHIYAGLVSADGVVQNTDGIQVCVGSRYEQTPDVCCDGSRYFIVWSDYRSYDKDIFGTFLDPDGAVSVENGTIVVNSSHHETCPSICWSGGQFFMAWERDNFNDKLSIYGGRLNAAGEMIDGDGFVLSDNSNGEYRNPDVASLDGDFISAYGVHINFPSQNEIFFRRVGADGELLDPSEVLLSDQVSLLTLNPSITSGGSAYMSTWTDSRSINYDIYAAMISKEAVVSPATGQDVSRGYNGQFDGDVAFDGTNYMVVWRDSRDEKGLNIYVTRVNQQGITLDQKATLIDSTMWERSEPVIGFNGSNYLVVWEMLSSIRAKRISPAGVVLDDEVLVLTPNNYDYSKPVIASDGSNWLVVFENAQSYPRDRLRNEIFGVLVGPDGNTITRGPFSIAGGDWYHRNADVLFNGSQYAVVWQDSRHETSYGNGIYAARITPEGSVLDPDGILLVEDPDIYYQDARLACDSSQYLLCFSVGFYHMNDLQAARFDLQFNALDAAPIIIGEGPDDLDNPQPVFADGKFTVLYTDKMTNGRMHVGKATISQDGDILDNAVFSGSESMAVHPAVCVGTSKQFLAVYSGFVEQLNGTPVNTLRMMGRLVGEGAGAGIDDHNALVMNMRTWPVPATSSIHVEYHLKEKSRIEVILYSESGKIVYQENIGEETEGEHRFSLDATGLSTGTYVLTLNAGRTSSALKVVVLH